MLTRPEPFHARYFISNANLFAVLCGLLATTTSLPENGAEGNVNQLTGTMRRGGFQFGVGFAISLEGK